MEQGGNQGLRIEAPVGDGAGHRERVRDVGISAGAKLAAVRGRAEDVGRFDAGDFFRLEIQGKLGPEKFQIFRQIDRSKYLRGNQRGLALGGGMCTRRGHRVNSLRRYVVNYAWPRLSSSSPTRPPAISRNATTVALSLSPST